MNKKQLIINYCNNTALNGFDVETEENKGEQWFAKRCIEILKEDLDFNIAIDKLDNVANIIKSKHSLDFFKGALLMYEDIKLHIDIINNDNFERDWKYEIEEGVFRSI